MITACEIFSYLHDTLWIHEFQDMPWLPDI